MLRGRYYIRLRTNKCCFLCLPSISESGHAGDRKHQPPATRLPLVLLQHQWACVDSRALTLQAQVLYAFQNRHQFSLSQHQHLSSRGLIPSSAHASLISIAVCFKWWDVYLRARGLTAVLAPGDIINSRILFSWWWCWWSKSSVFFCIELLNRDDWLVVILATRSVCTKGTVSFVLLCYCPALSCIFS